MENPNESEKVLRKALAQHSQKSIAIELNIVEECCRLCQIEIKDHVDYKDIK